MANWVKDSPLATDKLAQGGRRLSYTARAVKN